MGENFKVFKNDLFQVGIKLKNDEFVFNIESVAESLGFIQIKNQKEYVRWETVNRYLSEFGFSQQVGKGDFVSEQVVYLLAMKANNEAALKFQIWLATEVIPSIRINGIYKLPSNYSEALRELAVTVEEAERLKQENLLLKPKAEFYDDVAGSKDAIAIGDAAKVLNNGIGPYKLFQFLRDKKVLMQNNIPYQYFIDRGYFRIIEQKFITSKGETRINIKTLVYQKGLDYIRNLLKAN